MAVALKAVMDCASHDQPGWEAGAQAVVRLLFDGLRHTATAPL
ncbi:hypothetical protein ACFXKC_15585 [Streptomyces sp. NPDC059340]